jgi:hypothetical protein
MARTGTATLLVTEVETSAAPSVASVIVICVVKIPALPATTAALIGVSEVPAVIGSVPEYVQVSTVLLPLSAQVQLLGVGALENVSPLGSVAVTTGSLLALPPEDCRAGSMPRL